MTTLELVGGFKDAVLATGAMVGVYVALKGLNTWRRQLKGNVEYDLTRRFLKAIFSVRDAIQMIRGSWIITPADIVQAMRVAGYSDEQIANEKDHDRQTALVYEMWWKRVTEALSALEIEEVESEVVWDHSYRKATIPLRQCVLDLRVSVHMWLSIQQRSARGDSVDDLERYEKTIWRNSGEDDEYQARLLESVNGIESLIKPHLKK